MTSRRAALIGAAIVLVSAVTVVAVDALTRAATTPDVYTGCLDRDTRTLYKVGVNATAAPKCGTGDKNVTWNSQGPRGPRGLQGPKGDEGPPGPTSLAALEGTPCTTAQGNAGTVLVIVEEANSVALACDSPQQVIVQTQEAAQVLADRLFGTESERLTQVPAVCSGAVLIACPGGTPSSPLPTIEMDDRPQAGDLPRAVGTFVAGASRFDITGRARLSTPTAIPVSFSGVTCSLVIDTTAGAIDDVRVDFQVRVLPGAPTGPADVANVVPSQIGAEDVDLTGSPICDLADFAASFYLDLFLDSLLPYLEQQAVVCGAPAPLYFELCAG